jgi:dinuclear metal center YbgI/SA1388 family protein
MSARMKKTKMTSERLAQRLDDLLRIRAIPDDSLNGLQVANSGKLTRIATAVDASAASIREASEAKADFLIVHHGLFWGRPVPLIGPLQSRVRMLIESDIALYAVHLPLDLHPELGNNVQLCLKMGWKSSFDFGDYHGVTIGRGVNLREPISLESVTEKLRTVTRAEPVVWRFGPGQVRRVAVISGGAMGIIEQVAFGGYDTYITGEFGHAHYWFAREAGVNVVFGGHYATETLGVRALGEKIEDEFGLENSFLDLPTGY